MENLNVNGYQGLGAGFNRCKLTSVRTIEVDQFIHILQKWIKIILSLFKNIKQAFILYT